MGLALPRVTVTAPPGVGQGTGLTLRTDGAGCSDACFAVRNADVSFLLRETGEISFPEQIPQETSLRVALRLSGICLDQPPHGVKADRRPTGLGAGCPGSGLHSSRGPRGSRERPRTALGSSARPVCLPGRLLRRETRGEPRAPRIHGEAQSDRMHWSPSGRRLFSPSPGEEPGRALASGVHL